MKTSLMQGLSAVGDAGDKVDYYHVGTVRGPRVKPADSSKGSGGRAAVFMPIVEPVAFPQQFFRCKCESTRSLFVRLS